MSDNDWLDFDGGPHWFKTDKIYRCRHCGHTGPVEAEAEEETQGDGLMTGTVWLATGQLRCTECESSDLEQTSNPEGDPQPLEGRMSDKPKRIEPGHTVRFHFANSPSQQGELVSAPAATGDSWIIREKRGSLVYVQQFDYMHEVLGIDNDPF